MEKTLNSVGVFVSRKIGLQVNHLPQNLVMSGERNNEVSYDDVVGGESGHMV